MCRVFREPAASGNDGKSRSLFRPVAIVQLSRGSTSSMATTISHTQGCESQGLHIFPDSKVKDPAPWFVF